MPDNTNNSKNTVNDEEDTLDNPKSFKMLCVSIAHCLILYAFGKLFRYDQ